MHPSIYMKTRVKQYNSTYKTVISVDGVPVCITRSNKRASDIMSYLSGYEVVKMVSLFGLTRSENVHMELQIRQAEMIICMWQVRYKVQNDGLVRI